MSVRLAAGLHLRLDMRSLVRGALLHDYFLYDWHVPERGGTASTASATPAGPCSTRAGTSRWARWSGTVS